MNLSFLFLAVLGCLSVYASENNDNPDYQVDKLEDYSPGPSKKLKCFACTSYVPQCRTTVNETEGSVSNVGCKTKCFLREGEEKDPAWYRGCLDDFKDVVNIEKDYTGCRYQTWNGRKRLWCLCDSDMCNGVSIKSLAMGLTVSEKSYDPAPMRQGVAYNSYSQHKPSAKQQDYTYQDANKYGRQAPKVAQWLENKAFDEVYDQKPKPDQHKQGYAEVETPSYNDQKVYTDIEQVHYGQSNDIFVNPSDKAGENSHAYSDVSNGYDNKLEGSLVQQPYYPFPKEGQDQAYLGAGYPEEKQEDGAYRQQQPYDQPGAKQADLAKDDKKEVYLEEKPYDPSEDMERLAEKVLCDRTGFIPNPEDCSKFLACIMDAHIGKPVMYPMRCPAGLFWDNKVRVCVATSTTCKLPQRRHDVSYDDNAIY